MIDKSLEDEDIKSYYRFKKNDFYQLKHAGVFLYLYIVKSLDFIISTKINKFHQHTIKSKLFI